MNFVYIHTHDTGRYIEPYGISANNPGLSALAREGAIFRNMYCCGPTCSPSRASMLTGQAPHNTGMLGLAHRGFFLDRPKEHLANFLRENGYYTALFGVQHEAHGENIKKLGYDEITVDFGGEGSCTDLRNLEGVCDFLGKRAGSDRPFFLSFGLLNTHKPWPKESRYKQEYVIPPFPIADTKENRTEYCGFLESLSVVDRCVEKTVETLRENGLYENTVIMFTTDHGLALPNMKCNLYDTGIGVSFILRMPGYEHMSVDALCSHLDVFPTVCDALGLDKPSYLQGRSMMPLFDGRCDEINEFVFSEVTFHSSYQPMRCVRSKRFKLIRYYDGANERRFANIDRGSAKSLYTSTELATMTKDEEYFFDLYADPTERINLSGVSEYREEYLRHAAALEEWQRRTEDPIIMGKTMLDMGIGRLVNDADDMDPDPKKSRIIE